MKLREYRPEDADQVVTWVENETVLYQWSAFWISEFPLAADKFNSVLSGMQANVKLIPLIFCDEEERSKGFLFIRFLSEAERRVRFGFVIVDPEIRGKGYGKKMLELAVEYSKTELKAAEISLGVFENNPKARCAYEAVGFRATGVVEPCEMKIGCWNSVEMIYEEGKAR